MKNKKRILNIIFLCALSIILSSCGQNNNFNNNAKHPTGFFYGFLYKYLAIPIQHFMHWIVGLMGNPQNGFGWAIIIITIAVRIVLLPLMINQSKNMTIQQEKMNLIKPQIDIVQNHLKQNNSPEEQMKAQQLMIKIYNENNIKIIPSMGLTMIIQLPVFSGLYMAIEYSKNISHSFFLGINLGRSNIILTIIAALTYAIQGYISLYGMTQNQKKQMKLALLMSPLMTFIFCIISPAGLALYFLAGGIISIIQQFITSFWINPKIKQKLDEEIKNNPTVEVVNENTFKNTKENTYKTQNDIINDEIHNKIRQKNIQKKIKNKKHK